MPTYIITQLLKIKDKEKSLKTDRENDRPEKMMACLQRKKKIIQVTADFSSKNQRPEESGTFFKG